MRTSPVNAGFEHATSGGIVALRKRLDGGFNVAHERHSTAEILPASFRFLREFLPLIRAERRRIKFKIGKRFIDEMTFPRHWPLDQASPFERFRTMEAKPNPTVMKQAFSALSERYPVFKGATAIQMWAGVIDVTPDTVPVISPVARVPGFYLATGFSGHGFGVAPGAGKLIADLVLNERPCVDPEPFSYARFQRPGSTSHHS